MTATGAAYGMYSRSAALPDIVYSLNRAGFENENICMVLSPAHPVATAVRDARVVNAERDENAVSARMIGWFSEFGAVVIPTVGFFIRSRAFFRALMDEQKPSTRTGGSRTLEGLGFTEDEAKRLGHELSDVGALVYVSCPESAKTDRAVEALRHTGAREVASLQGCFAAASAA